jgi:hypothetical protein
MLWPGGSALKFTVEQYYPEPVRWLVGESYQSEVLTVGLKFRHILQSMLISTTQSHGLKLGCRPVVAAMTSDYSFLLVIMALV